MRLSSSATLITDPVEIDLYECMKYDRIRNNGQIRAYIPPPYNQHVYLQLCRTRQWHGWRTWFLAKCCGRRTSKLYTYGVHLACRHCLELKYPSQYRKDAFGQMIMSIHKLNRIKKQKRRLWYSDKPTQFGKQYYKLLAERY